MVALPVTAQQIWVNSAVPRWDLIALSSVIGIALVALALARRLTYTVRSTAFCGVMAFGAAAAWVLAGFTLESAALHLTAILLAALLMGPRAAAVVLLFESISLLVGAVGHLQQWLPTDPHVEAAGLRAENWATGGVLLTATALILGVGLTVLLRDIEGARHVAVDLAEQLAQESASRLLEIQRREETQRLLVAAQRRDALAHLAGGLAHDFNNLLTVVLYAFNESQNEVREGGPASEAIALGRTAAENTAALTRQLLAYSRGDPQGKTATDLAPVLRTAIAIIRRLLPKNVDLQVDLPDRLPAVSCIPAQIQQVLLNLAVNARDAMPNGGHLEIFAREDGDVVEFRVSDDGTGIEPDIAERIFEPLFSTKDVGQGTGLGLAVVATVVADHGGTIRVQSRSGQGSTFEVRLPRSAANVVNPVSDEPTSRPATKLRLLIVDDDEPLRLLAARSLRALGHDVDVASSADRAMRAIASHGAPDVLVTDLSMPGMSGAVFASKMLAAHAALRVLIISGYGIDDRLAEVLATGRADVLVKPFTAQSLADAIDELARKR